MKVGAFDTCFALVSPKNRDPKHRSRRIGKKLFISNAFVRPRINLTWRSITRHNAIALVSVHFGVLGLEKVSLVRFLSMNGKDPGICSCICQPADPKVGPACQ